jgi:hypothetical protein
MALKEPKMNNPRRQPGGCDYRRLAALKELNIAGGYSHLATSWQRDLFAVDYFGMTFHYYGVEGGRSGDSPIEISLLN